MNTSSWTRRDCIKAAIAAGGVALSGISTLREAQAASSPNAGHDTMLSGVCDIHLHAAPDTRARSIDEFTFAKDAHKAGYKAVMFKSNHWACHDRAYLIRQALSDFACFGSLCMNRVHGSTVNVYAAEQAVQTTDKLCRCIWMPTQDATYQCAAEKRSDKGIPVLSEAGTVLPEVIRVMEICAEADIIFATGHSSPAESLVLARKAREIRVTKFVVTHANALLWKMSREQILRIVDEGGFIEYCYLPCLWGAGTALSQYPRQSEAEFLEYVRIAPEQTFISTDLGQANMPHPVDGMRHCLAMLRKAGIPQKNVDSMVRHTPAKLLGLSA